MRLPSRPVPQVPRIRSVEPLSIPSSSQTDRSTPCYGPSPGGTRLALREPTDADALILWIDEPLTGLVLRGNVEDHDLGPSRMTTATKAVHVTVVSAKAAGETDLMSVRKKNGVPLVVLIAIGILAAFLRRPPAEVVFLYVVLAIGAAYFGLSWVLGALRLASGTRASGH